MLEKIRYVNSRGEVLNFGAAGLYINENDLRNWEWSYETDRGRINNLSRKPITRSLPVKVWASTDKEGLALKNQLHDVTHVDLIAGTPGRLYIGDNYMVCYIVASSKANYLTSDRVADLTLTVAADQAIWYQDTEIWFGERQGLQSAIVDEAIVGFARVGSDGTDGSEETVVPSYPRGYPYGYTQTVTASSDIVTNNFVAPCDWRITIKGPAANPEINIGAETHRLAYTISADESIEIDSRRRTITATKADGVEANIFRFRDKEKDIFARIKPGSHLVTWNGDYIFSITLYKERSEPLWI